MVEIERLPNEPSRWYDRLVRFATLGPNRSILAVYQQEIASKGKINIAKSPPSSWTAAARAWQWRDRAAAYDREHQRTAFQAEQEQRTKMLKRHLQAAQAWQARAITFLTRLDEAGKPYTIDDPMKAYRIWEMAVKAERLAMGLPNKLLEYVELSDEQLRTKYADLLESIIAASNDSDGEEELM